MVLPLLKKHIRLGHDDIMDHSVNLSTPDFLKKYEKGMDRSNNNNKKENKIPAPYGSMVHMPTTNLLLLAAKQEPYKKSLSLNEKY